MNRREMLKRLKAGEKPIDLAIEKWEDIRDGKGRDRGHKNCALCEVDEEKSKGYCNYFEGCCNYCPITKYYKYDCITLGHPYISYLKTKDPTMMLHLLYWVKQKMIENGEY